MLVELAAKGLEHGYQGRDWGGMSLDEMLLLVFAAGVLDACHLLGWLVGWLGQWGRENTEVGLRKG